MRTTCIALWALILVLVCSSAAFGAPRVMHASPQGTCDGYPRLDIQTVRGMCAGLIAGPTAADRTRTLVLPRTLAQLTDDTWLVTDLGNWNRASGSVWELRTRKRSPTQLRPLLRDLSLPHTVVMGSDGLAYVGEMGRITRFDPTSKTPGATLEVVIDDLPDNRLHPHRHPLSKFVMATDGALLVNVGAPSDQCLAEDGKPSGERCLESETGESAASIRRYPRIAPGRWSQKYSIYARGLRNSMALALHASGTLLQAENSYDFAERWSPFEEINVVERGRHYGWPYCADIATPTPAWRKAAPMGCATATHSPPAILLPPHAAPLDMLWYEGAMFPALSGRLLMSWHGHRSIGGRIVAFRVDDRGVPRVDADAKFPVYGEASRAYGAAPAATPVVLTPGWGRVDGRRPQGSPVGLAVARDGAIWATDDRAGLVIRFAEDRD